MRVSVCACMRACVRAKEGRRGRQAVGGERVVWAVSPVNPSVSQSVSQPEADQGGLSWHIETTIYRVDWRPPVAPPFWQVGGSGTGSEAGPWPVRQAGATVRGAVVGQDSADGADQVGAG